MNHPVHPIQLGTISAHVLRKRIRHMNLRIVAPDGDVRITAPLRMSMETIRAFALSKLGWILKHQTRIRARPAREKSAPLTPFEKRQMMHRVRMLLDKWEPAMGVEVSHITLQHMKTRWGSCTPSRRRIRLNTELWRRNPEFLEYVVVHELCHFFERGHGARFKRLMDRYLPNWRELRAALNATAI